MPTARRCSSFYIISRRLTPDVPTIGTALCLKCYNTLRLRRQLPKRFSLKSVKDALADVTTADTVSARACKNNKGPLCRLCREHIAAAVDPVVRPKSPGSELKPFTRRRLSVHHDSATPPPELSSADLMESVAAGSSARATGRFADNLRSSDTTARSVSGALFRRDLSRHNRVFSHLFSDVDCAFSNVDGAGYVCLDITLFVLLIAFLRGQSVRDLAIVKFIVDAGQGSLKFLMQLLWRHDPVFSGLSYDARRRDNLRGTDSSSDNGANRTFIVGKIMTSAETFTSVRFLTDRYNYKRFKSILSSSCEIIGPNDIKMSALLAGIGPSGSRNPQPCTLFSMYTGHSQPDVWRTTNDIIKTFKKRRAAEAEQKAPDKTAMLWHSVDAMPCRLLQELFLDKKVADFLIPPQLHLLLGLVATLMQFLFKLDEQLYLNFIRAIGVLPNKRYSDTDFHGNPSRKILRSHEKLRGFLSARPLARHAGESSSPKYCTLLCHSLCDTLAALSKVVSSCMGGALDPHYLASIKHFLAAYDTFVSQYNKRVPVAAGRVSSRYTMKTECLRVEVPRRLQHTQRSLLPDSEQGAESVHSLEKQFAANYKIPHSTVAISSRSKPQPLTKAQRSAKNRLTARSAHIANPSDGTRSGQSLRKRKHAEAFSTPVPTTAQSPATPQLNLPNVRRKRLQQMLGWNRHCLPRSRGVFQRMEIMLD